MRTALSTIVGALVLVGVAATAVQAAPQPIPHSSQDWIDRDTNQN